MTASVSETSLFALQRGTTGPFPAFLKRWHRWYRHRRDLKETRLAFMHVVHLEDRLLDDMGVTRDDVLWAAALPLEVNAAKALRLRAQRQRTTRPRTL